MSEWQRDGRENPPLGEEGEGEGEGSGARADRESRGRGRGAEAERRRPGNLLFIPSTHHASTTTATSPFTTLSFLTTPLLALRTTSSLLSFFVPFIPSPPSFSLRHVGQAYRW